MSIEKYFRTLQRQIEGCPAIVNTIVTYEKRDHAHGFIRGELFFIDGSVLHLLEFVQVADDVDRQTYAYQYMAEDRQLIFRYDNADHYAHLNLPSHPHHKHDRSETQVIGSNAPMLADVLAEIERMVKLDSARAQPPKSLRGSWQGQELSAEELDEARKEMWRNFPREDV